MRNKNCSSIVKFVMLCCMHVVGSPAPSPAMNSIVEVVLAADTEVAGKAPPHLLLWSGGQRLHT